MSTNARRIVNQFTKGFRKVLNSLTIGTEQAARPGARQAQPPIYPRTGGTNFSTNFETLRKLFGRKSKNYNYTVGVSSAITAGASTVLVAGNSTQSFSGNMSLAKTELEYLESFYRTGMSDMSQAQKKLIENALESAYLLQKSLNKEFGLYKSRHAGRRVFGCFFDSFDESYCVDKSWEFHSSIEMLNSVIRRSGFVAGETTQAKWTGDLLIELAVESGEQSLFCRNMRSLHANHQKIDELIFSHKKATESKLKVIQQQEEKQLPILKSQVEDLQRAKHAALADIEQKKEALSQKRAIAEAIIRSQAEALTEVNDHLKALEKAQALEKIQSKELSRARSKIEAIEHTQEKLRAEQDVIRQSKVSQSGVQARTSDGETLLPSGNALLPSIFEETLNILKLTYRILRMIFLFY